MKKFSFNIANNYYLKIIAVFIIWRVFLFILAYISPNFIPVWGNRFPYAEEHLISSSFPYWVWSWGNFDGVHYLNIAKSFYSAYYTQTFFPFYPLLIRLFNLAFLINNYLLSALIVSSLSFILSLFVFYKLLKLEGYKKNILWVLVFLLLFPTSFYFVSVYTESLFFLLLISSIFLFRQKRWFIAGIIGALASFTRLFGIFIAIVFIVEYLMLSKKERSYKMLIAIGLVPLGLLTYMLYLYLKFNDPLLFWHAQSAFGAERVSSRIILPIQVLYRYFKILFTVDFRSLSFFNAIYEMISFVFAVFILIIGHLKKIRLSYLVFSWLSLITPSLTGTFSSMPRYILIIFPIYIILASIKSSALKLLILTFNTALLIVGVFLFTRAYWLS